MFDCFYIQVTWEKREGKIRLDHTKTSWKNDRKLKSYMWWICCVSTSHFFSFVFFSSSSVLCLIWKFNFCCNHSTSSLSILKLLAADDENQNCFGWKPRRWMVCYKVLIFIIATSFTERKEWTEEEENMWNHMGHQSTWIKKKFCIKFSPSPRALKGNVTTRSEKGNLIQLNSSYIKFTLGVKMFWWIMMKMGKRIKPYMIRHHIAIFEYTFKYYVLGFIHQTRIICMYMDGKKLWHVCLKVHR